MKALKNFLGTVKKTHSSVKKTAKSEPFSLAATALRTLAEMSQDNENYNKRLAGARSPGSSLFNAAATMTQGYYNAKAARKNKERSQKASNIVATDFDENGQKYKTTDKVKALFALGEDKLANNLLKLHGVKKTFKYKKKDFGEKVRMDDYHIGDTDRKFKKDVADTAFEHNYKNKTFDHTVSQDNFNNNFKNRTFDQTERHFDTNRGDRKENALINAFGQVLKGQGNPKQLLELIKNPSLAAGIKTKKGIPMITKKSVVINKPEYLPEDDARPNVLKKLLSKLGI
jgi:hypothetical protein